MKLVLDTNIFIDKLRGGTKWDEFLSNIDKDAEMYLPTIVIFELFSGLSSKKKPIIEEINGFKKYFHQVDLTWNIARRAAEIHRDCPQSTDAFDCIIGATAIEIGAQVVTLNQKHFQKIPGVSIYEIS
jgi:predicted nucleic acid-binding protein